ncbi:MAG TPA: uridine kinase [Candidatus Atribacteria bacterium]|nr:uridine kinase [Candidatus Atribacteria bacterium]HPT78438.1 uridine kinase [Candidatus Atribacteria bacterium]
MTCKAKKAEAFRPVFDAIERLDRQGMTAVIAIDGRSGSGKSMLSGLIQNRIDCNVFHMDDFFLQPHQRTEERLAEPGGNIDYERFMSEVIGNIKSGREFEYRVFDCSAGELGGTVRVAPKRINIIEGVYSMHPLWYPILDLKVFLYVNEAVQQERILERSGEEKLKRFIGEWIPLEEKYFSTFRIRENSDIVIDTSAVTG